MIESKKVKLFKLYTTSLKQGCVAFNSLHHFFFIKIKFEWQSKILKMTAFRSQESILFCTACTVLFTLTIKKTTVLSLFHNN